MCAGRVHYATDSQSCATPLLSVTYSLLRGQATTLKRNGSDFSATILGSLFRSSYITIWTDVDGVYSADPRKVCVCVWGGASGCCGGRGWQQQQPACAVGSVSAAFVTCCHPSSQEGCD